MRALIKGMLKHRFPNLARILATVIIGFTFYNFIGSEMMPLADVGQANGFLEMQPGTSFQQTEQAVEQLEQIMLKHPELETRIHRNRLRDHARILEPLLHRLPDTPGQRAPR